MWMPNWTSWPASAKLEQDLQRVNGKLDNEKFLRNAPPEVVAKEQAKLEELKARLAKN